MTSGEVDTLPSSSGAYVLKPTVDQPAPPDALDLPVNLVRLGWVRARGLLVVVLRCVDHWVHKSHLVCKNTRNCVLCGAGDNRLKQVGLEEKRAERLLFRAESDVISKSLPPQQLERFCKQDGIWWSTGKFDSSTRLKFEDVELNLPFFDENVIAPVVPVVRDGSGIFHAYVTVI